MDDDTVQRALALVPVAPGPELWWCTACNAWRWPLHQSQIGTSCTTCRSGRIRPPLRGETPK